MDVLRGELCELARKTDAADARLYLVGGYGLLLKAEHLRRTGAETVAATTYPRATDDLDVLLSADIVVDSGRMAAVRDALRDLGYSSMPGREHYQWSRDVEAGGRSRRIKIDLLGQIPEDRSDVSVRDRRMRPRAFEGLHAHPIEEAALVHVCASTIDVCPEAPPGFVRLPHPFSYLLLKLHAFDDRKEDPDADYGRHHAFDIFRIVSMITREEWDEVKELRERQSDVDVVQRAQAIVGDCFSDREQLGALRLREHQHDRVVDEVDYYPVAEFLGDLRELLLGE